MLAMGAFGAGAMRGDRIAPGGFGARAERRAAGYETRRGGFQQRRFPPRAGVLRAGREPRPELHQRAAALGHCADPGTYGQRSQLPSSGVNLTELAKSDSRS